jgi:putative DNA primase/helicase
LTYGKPLPIQAGDGPTNYERDEKKEGLSSLNSFNSSVVEAPKLPDRQKKPDARAEIEAALRAGILPCTKLAALGIPPRERLLGEWFLEGDLGFIFAPRGLGKTWQALAMATAIAAGGKCGPWEANGSRRVPYVDGEMPCEALCERIEGLGDDENLTVLNHEALFHISGKVLNLADPVTQDVLTAQMLANGVKVLFLDNLSCLFSGVKENDADAWEAVLGWLLTLRRHRIAVVLVHHSGRNKENMRGTSRREDAAMETKRPFLWCLRFLLVSPLLPPARGPPARAVIPDSPRRP